MRQLTQRLGLKQVLVGAAAALAVASLLAGLYSAWSFAALANTDTRRTAAADAVHALADTRFHVVQIQQFLTDVGATHDDGGFAEAASNLAAAQARLAELRRVAPELGPKIDAVLPRLAAVHDVGVEMARAYVSAGIDAGNRIMKR